MKKILFISNQGLSPLHSGIEMEVIEDLLSNKNNEIILSVCNKSIPSCFFNPTGNPVACAICTARTHKLLKSVSSLNLEIVTFPEMAIDKNLFDDYSISNISSWTLDGIKIGSGILSSVISIKRDYDIQSELSLNEAEFQIAAKSLLGFKKLLEKYTPDEVYLFNGRFSEVYPMVSLCGNKDIPFKTIEVGSSNQKYLVFENDLPHSINLFEKNCAAFWSENTSGAKVSLGTNWFQDASNGVKKNDHNYILGQVKDLLPNGLPHDKIKIAIFNSSEDEMKAIEEWAFPCYENQNDALRLIFEEFKHDKKFFFYLRIHPNLASIENSQTKELQKFDYPNLVKIEASSPVDSYALLRECDLVITFGSTIGIEATFHGKPSILFGKALYQNMDVTYNPNSYEELFALIRNFKNLSPKPKANTIPYGFYVSQSGIEYRFFKYHSKNRAWYKGKKIRRFYPLTFWYLLKYLKDIPLWRKKFEILYGRKPSLMDLKHLKLK